VMLTAFCHGTDAHVLFCMMYCVHLQIGNLSLSEANIALN